MGLDTTHYCWHGPYSSFGRWRKKIAEVAGYGKLDDYVGFGGVKEWPKKSILEELLHHSDCDGKIRWSSCEGIADKLEALLPALSVADEDEVVFKTNRFIAGLRLAAKEQENVEFH